MLQFYLKHFSNNKDKINCYLVQQEKFNKNVLVKKIGYINNYFDLSLDNLCQNHEAHFFGI